MRNIEIIKKLLKKIVDFIFDINKSDKERNYCKYSKEYKNYKEYR